MFRSSIKTALVGVGVLCSFEGTAQDTIKSLPTVDIINVRPPVFVSDIRHTSPRFVINEKYLEGLGVLDVGSALKFIPGSPGTKLPKQKSHVGVFLFDACVVLNAGRDSKFDFCVTDSVNDAGLLHRQ